MKTVRRTGLLTRTALGTAILIAAGFSPPAQAQTTVAGQVNGIFTNGSGGTTVNTSGATTTITSGNGRTLLNWNSLNLQNGNTLQYVVGNRSDIVLNRVLSGGATINGNVNSNVGSTGGAVGGNIWFSAPSGVTFGGTARVNVGGLLATPLGLADADFLDGNGSYNFTGVGGTVAVNSGAILNANGGALALIAPAIVMNGTINDTSAANKGSAFLGAGQDVTITFAPDSAGDLDLLTWTVAGGTMYTSPINASGAITAGNIYLAAVSRQDIATSLINVSSALTADGAVANGDGNIVLVAGGGIANGAATGASGGAMNLTVGATEATGDVILNAANGLLTINAQARVGRNYAITAQDFTGSGGAFYPQLASPGGDLTITDTSGGLVVGNLAAPGTLTLNSFGGDLTVLGTLTSASESIVLEAGGSLSLQGALTTSAGQSVALRAAGSVTQNASGTITTGTLTGYSSGGVFDLDDAVNNVATLDQVSGATGLRFREANGLTLSGAIGGGTGGVSVAVDTGALMINNANLGGSQGLALTAGSMAIASSTLDAGTSGDVTLNGDVAASGNTSMSGRDVSFSGTLDGAANLSINSARSTSLGAAVGGTTPLQSLSIIGSGTATLNGNITTSGAQFYSQAINLNSAATLASSGGGAITLAAVNGAHAFAVNTSGTTTFNGWLGVDAPLASLSTDAGGTTRFNGEWMVTTGKQTYGDAVQLLRASSLYTNGGDIRFGGTIDGGYALSLVPHGNIAFGGTVGGTTPIASLAAQGGGGTVSVGTTITATGALDFRRPLSLTGNTTLTGSGGVFSSVSGNGYDLSINHSTTTTITGLFTGIRNLSSAGGGTTRLSGAITTSGSQTYADDVVLNGATTLESTSAGAIAFGSGVDGPQSLAVNTAGATTFTGAIGATTALRSIATNAGGTTAINGGSVRTTSTQTFGDNVVLGAATTLTGAATALTGASSSLATLSGSGNDLTINYSGVHQLDGASITGVRNFTAGGGGTTELTGTLATTGMQSFSDAVSLTGNAILAGTTGSFGAGVQGNGHDLTLHHSGASAIDGSFTGIKNLATGALGTTTLSGQIVTSGSQTYSDMVTLAGATTLSSIGTGAAGNLTLMSVNASGQSLTLNTGGGVNFNGDVTNAASLVASAGSANINGTLSANTTLTISTTAGDINVGQGVTAGFVTMNAAGSILGSGRVTGGDVTLTGGTGIGTSNTRFNTAAGNLAASAGSGSSVYIHELDGVTIRSQNGTVNQAGARYDLVAQSIQLAGPITVSDGSASLEATGTGAQAITLAGDVSALGAAGQIRLVSAGAIVQTSGGLTAQSLTGSSVDRTHLSGSTNNIASLQAFSSGGEFRYRDVDALRVDGSVSAGSGLYLTTASQDLTLAADLSANGINLTTLAGSVLQTGGILRVSTLNGSISGDAILTQQNQISRISSLSANRITLNDVGGLIIAGAVQGNLATGDVTIRTMGGNLTLGGLASVSGRNVALSTDGAFINNGTSPIVTDAAGHWVVYSAAPDGNVFGSLNSGNVARWNSTIDTVTPGSLAGNRYVFAVQPTVTLTSTGGNKTYGTDLTGLGGYSVSGLHPGVAGAFLGDTAATAFSGTPLVASPGFAERATVAGGPYAVGISAGTASGLNGYALAFISGGSITVTPKAVTASVSVDPKTYDSTTVATGAFSLTGTLVGDDVAAGGTLAFADKNAGANKTVTLSGAALTGADAGNYSLVLPAAIVGEIIQATIRGEVSANNKTYDGTIAANGSVSLSGVVAGDDVAAGATFAFADKNAGQGKIVQVSNAALSGTDAGNYTLTLPASVVADILKKAIAGTATASSKTYDGTTAANGSVSLSGVVVGDNVTAGATFAFADRNAGQGKTVLVSDAALSGADAGNYTLTLPASVLADILKKAIVGTATANSKTYDGTTAANGGVSLSGVVTGDDVAAGATFAFTDKNAGQGKAVLVSDAALSGADAGNYTLTVPASVTADILQKTISGTVVANDKTYDGTTAATGTINLAGVIQGDDVAANATFSFLDKNAGEGKALTISGVTLAGADGSNYALEIPAAAVASILRKTLVATATAQPKTYDGTTAATGAIALSGLIEGDRASASAAFAFEDANAGAGKRVQITGATLNGADAGNYRMIVPASTVADILRRAISVSATPLGKDEGSADPALTYELNAGTLVAGDGLTGSLSRQAGEAPGQYAIERGTLAASDNYILTFIGATLTIRPLDQADPLPVRETLVRPNVDEFLAFISSGGTQGGDEVAPLRIGEAECEDDDACAAGGR